MKIGVNGVSLLLSAVQSDDVYFTHIGLCFITFSFDAGEIRLTLLKMTASFSLQLFPDENSGGKFRIIVGHSPDFAASRQDADLLLAGHTHGGQVQIPGLGAILTFARYLPRHQASGQTKLPSGSILIVSNGTGYERSKAPRLRFFCRPDFWVINLEPER